MKKLMIVYAVSIFIVFSLQSAEQQATTLVPINQQLIEAYKARRKARKVSETSQAVTTQTKPVDFIAYLEQLDQQIANNNKFIGPLKTRLAELLEEELVVMLSGIGIKELPTIIQNREDVEKEIDRLNQENFRLDDAKILVTRVIVKQ